MAAPAFKKDKMSTSERIHNDDIYAVLHNELTLPFAMKYLNIYVGVPTATWKPYLDKLWIRTKNDKEKMRRAVACTILLPMVDRATFVASDHPENLLNRILWYNQLEERDWFAEFQTVVRQDGKVDVWRQHALQLGIIRPLEYAPLTRQAYNWLYLKAEESGVITSPGTKRDVTARFTNLVEAYGGAVICNIFSRHQETLKRIVNWRTGYFFERNIFNVYEPEQVIKIKKAELEQTNTTLVKQIRLVP